MQKSPISSSFFAPNEKVYKKVYKILLGILAKYLIFIGEN